MANGGRLGARNVPGVDGTSGVWSMREIADVVRRGSWVSSPHLYNDDILWQYTKYPDSSSFWHIQGGMLVAAGGTGNHALILNHVSAADIAIECDCDYAQDGGLILRFVDSNNHYMLALRDDSGAAPTQNFRLLKKVAGSFTELATSNFTWTRGTSVNVRFSVSGTTIKVFADGVEKISVTDSSITGPGGIGFRSDTSRSQYLALRWGV